MSQENLSKSCFLLGFLFFSVSVSAGWGLNRELFFFPPSVTQQLNGSVQKSSEHMYIILEATSIVGKKNQPLTTGEKPLKACHL